MLDCGLEGWIAFIVVLVGFIVGICPRKTMLDDIIDLEEYYKTTYINEERCENAAQLKTQPKCYKEETPKDADIEWKEKIIDPFDE